MARESLVKAASWSLVSTYGGFLLKFIFAIAITRLLTPRDYGLVAYTAIFLSLAGFLSSSGFGEALIQKKDIRSIDYATAYVFNTSVSLFFFFAYFLAAPYVAAYFLEPELTLILRVASLNLLFNSFCYVHQFRLIKEIRFKEQAAISFVSGLLAGIIGLSLALKDFNYWALVIQTLSASAFRMLGFWLALKWIPKLQFNVQVWKEQYRFGFNIFLLGLVNSIFTEIYTVVIGKQYNAARLGDYARGKKFFELFIMQTSTAFTKVIYPSLTRESGDASIQAHIYHKAYSQIFFLMAPLALCLHFLAEPIILVLLTEKWSGAIAPMQIFCLAGLVFANAHLNDTTLLSQNKPRLYLVMGLVHKALLLFSLLLTYRINIEAIVIGWVITYFIYALLGEFIVNKQRGFYNIQKYKKITEVAVSLIPMYLAHRLLLTLPLSDFGILAVSTFIQPLVYLGVMKGLNFQVYQDFKNIIIVPFAPAFIKRFV